MQLFRTMFKSVNGETSLLHLQSSLLLLSLPAKQLSTLRDPTESLLLILLQL